MGPGQPGLPGGADRLYGPGTDSGTFDYFTDEINGEEGASRSDYNASEDDNVLVQGVAGSANALGYFGYTYYEENQDSLKAVEIDKRRRLCRPVGGDLAGRQLHPLSRPLFVYVSNKAYAEKPQVAAFIDYYVDNDAAISEDGPVHPAQRRPGLRAEGHRRILGG